MLLSVTACGERKIDDAEKGTSKSQIEQAQPKEENETQNSPPINQGAKSKIDDNFIKNVVINFGAVERENENGDKYLKEEDISLFVSDKWDKDTMKAGDLFSWYMGYMWREDFTYEEQYKKYKNPLGEDMGWFFPADIYEPTVMKYFDVTEEFLRSDEIYYNKEHNGYTLGGGGGKGISATITIKEWKQENDIVNIYLNLFAEDYENRDMVLTIKITDEGYKFVSYLP